MNPEPGVLNARPAEECRFDLVALGEVMLRLDPGTVGYGSLGACARGRVAGSTTSLGACGSASACVPVS